MSQIDTEITAYEKMLAALEAQHHGKWVVIHDSRLTSVHSDFETAAAEAVHRFGRGPYLIRQVGAQKRILPAAFASRPLYAAR
ncbi:MAG TPA: hypothetical protein VGT78_12575 [Rhizomicrobium sp.]|nr:hypothetical protein [Rhizomicrobium sp.]